MAGRTDQPQPFEQSWLDKEFHQDRRRHHNRRLSDQERLDRNLDSESSVGQWRGSSNRRRELKIVRPGCKISSTIILSSKGEFAYAVSHWYVASRGCSGFSALRRSAR